MNRPASFEGTVGDRMANCRGCGTLLENPTQDEINQAVEDVLVASLKDAKKHGEICPLCGHSQAQPVSHRKSIQFVLLLSAMLIAIGVAVSYFRLRDTERQSVAQEALKQVASDSQITQLLGRPLSIRGDIIGAVKQDETGWHEVKLTIPIQGPIGDGVLQVSGGRESGAWKFTTLEVLMPQLKKKADLISGRIVQYDNEAYVDTHTEVARPPEYVLADVPAPRWGGDFPCVYAVAGRTSAPQIGNCVTPVPMSKASRTPVDRFETDLRAGRFVMRQTDVTITEAGFDIPLTRTYTSDEWLPNNKSHAFGVNANHPYDIAPLGTRNPYTEQFIVLEDGDFLYFPRISNGTGYGDAIYRQSEIGNSFYKAVQRWDGSGWLTQLQDGSSIHFPESYNAQNLAQGAPTEMTDAAGKRIELIRNPRRNLQEIRSFHGSIKLTYDDHDRIVRADDGQGRWARYVYNPSGFLTDAVQSDGSARYYFYEGGQLTFVRDEQKHLLLHNFYFYEGSWLQKQEYGNGDVVQYRYDLSPNKHYAERVSVTLADGTVRTIDTRNSVSEVYKRMR